MNVGPASTVWPVQGGTLVERQGGREASASDGDPAFTADEISLSEDGAGPEKKMDAREMLRLLTEGRGIMEGHFPVGSHTAAMDRQDAPERKGTEGDIGALSKKVYDSLRDILNSGLFDEKVRAVLEEAFAPSHRDADETIGDESIDAEQLHREMQEAFERFHASLKRIFRIVEEDESEEDGISDKVEARAEAATAEAMHVDGTESESEEEIAREYEKFVRELITTVQKALEDTHGDKDSTDEPSLLVEPEEDGAHARFISAYEELYDWSSERRPLFNIEG